MSLDAKELLKTAKRRTSKVIDSLQLDEALKSSLKNLVLFDMDWIALESRREGFSEGIKVAERIMQKVFK
jgi:hypothetical protein